MSNEQKLREALRETLLFCETFSNRWDGETGAHPFGMVERARQALATTEPEHKWECFSDPSYFDMWAVKQISNQRFDDAYHVTSEVEARRLCALLNTSADLNTTTAKAAPAVPQGWKLVPVEMTDEMRDAGNEFICNRYLLKSAYTAMLAATPAAPSQPVSFDQWNSSPYTQVLHETIKDLSQKLASMTQSQPVTLTDEEPDPTLSALMGMPVSRKVWGEFKAWQSNKEAALREKEENRGG